MKSSGIGGQAVIEGIMMKNKDRYAVAVRKPDHKIEVDIKEYKGIIKNNKIKHMPIIRGVMSFVDSLLLGMKTLMYSASFFEEEEEQKPSKTDQVMNKLFKEKAQDILMGITMIVSIFIAVALFMMLPYFISDLLRPHITSNTVLALIEGLIRISLFIGYILLISLMKDIQRTFMYHGAEHKCINCIESGLPLTVENVMKSSKQHKRCGTSFLLIVMLISVIFFLFIRTDNSMLRIVLRILFVPVIAGVSYEFIRLAGNSESKVVEILSKPGLCMQKLTTREPDEDMVEVAIQAVEAVFDWRIWQIEMGYREKKERNDQEESAASDMREQMVEHAN